MQESRQVFFHNKKGKLFKHMMAMETEYANLSK